MGEAGWRGGVPERSGAVWGAARVILGEGASGTVQGRRGGPGRLASGGPRDGSSQVVRVCPRVARTWCEQVRRLDHCEESVRPVIPRYVSARRLKGGGQSGQVGGRGP